MHLSEREHITPLVMRGVANLLNVTFSDRPLIAKSTVQKTIRRRHFEVFGSVKDSPQTGRSKSATSEDKSVDVMQYFIEDRHIFIPKAAQKHEIDTFSVHHILKRCKFNPYRIK